MYAFYAFGVTDLQDIIPILLSSLKQGKKCWLCFFDNLLVKKQFYYYDNKEVVGFIQQICTNNNLPVPHIDFFLTEDKDRFSTQYAKSKPEIVFIQNIVHKSISWYPTAKNSKVIHLAWHKDGARHICSSPYDISMNVLRKEVDLEYYGVSGIQNIPDWYSHRISDKQKLMEAPTEYFGNFRLEHLRYKPVSNSLPTEEMLNSKSGTCFIVESHLRNDLTFRKETGRFVDEILDFFHSNNFYIVWKAREKGFPKQKWCSPLDVSTKKPDFIIDKDLNFPSSLIYLPLVSDICLTINSTNAIFDMQEVNSNSYVAHPAVLSNAEAGRFKKRFYGHVKRIHFKSNSQWDILESTMNNKMTPQPPADVPASSLLLSSLQDR
jgi:hypothetical protein